MYYLLLLLGWPQSHGLLTATLLFVAAFCWWYGVIYHRFVSPALLALLAIILLLAPPGLRLRPYAALAVLALFYL